MRAFFALIALSCLCSVTVFAQTINVNLQNRTIAITAEDFVEAEPDVAVVTLGYVGYGPTQEAAFEDNVRVAGQVTTALVEAGVPKTNIRSERVRLRRTDPDEKWTAEQKKQKQFQAEQTWTVQCAAAEAQTVLAAAVRAGANDVVDVDWDVADRTALQAKAGEKALEKARHVAQQMATGLGSKAGALVYSSNRAPAPPWLPFGATLETSVSTLSRNKAPSSPLKVVLFPKKVKADATVYAVFALE